MALGPPPLCSQCAGRVRRRSSSKRRRRRPKRPLAVLRGPDPKIEDACPSRKPVVDIEGPAIADERFIKSMHIIRLRGPWEYKPLAHVWIGEGDVRRESVESLPPGGRIELPQYESGSAIPERAGREQLPGGPIGEVRLEIRSLAQQTNEGTR